MKTIRTVLLASGAALLLSTGIAAAAPGTARTDLNVRSGPGTNYPVVGALRSGETVDVQGCTGSWCQVSFSGGSGFANQSYLAMAGGPGVGVAVTEGYAPGYAYSDPYYGYDDDSYGYGYDYGPSVGVFVGGGRFHNGHRYDHRWGGRPGGWQGRPGVAAGNWQGRPGGFQGRPGFSGNRVGAAPGSVGPVGRGGPTMSAPVGLGGGGARMGGGGPRMGGGGGAHIGGGGGGAHVGGGGGAAVRR
jgi:uncharacterized protein YraI